MHRRTYTAAKMTALLASVAFSHSAFAQDRVIYGPRVEATAVSVAHQGPYTHQASAHIINGVTQPDTYAEPGGTAVTASAGPGAVTAATTMEGNNGYGVQLHSDAFASTDAARGIFKATVGATGPNNFGSPLGLTQNRIDDTIFFHNSSGTTQTLSFTFRFDGQIYNPNGGTFGGGNVSLDFSCAYYYCYNSQGAPIVFATGTFGGGPRAPDDGWQYFFNASGGGYFGENIYGGQNAAQYFQYGLNQPGAGGVVDGFISTSFIIPTGETSLGIRGILNLDCREGISCDFGHTGIFRFGDLPTGLTFTSASGNFLTNITSAVPEPSAWALMIGGFGLIGSALRRRRARARPAMRPGIA